MRWSKSKMKDAIQTQVAFLKRKRRGWWLQEGVVAGEGHTVEAAVQRVAALDGHENHHLRTEVMATDMEAESLWKF
jgi:hypothetical protein